jgi:hypothetical protein
MAPELAPVATVDETDDPNFEPDIDIFDEELEVLEAEVEIEAAI